MGRLTDQWMKQLSKRVKSEIIGVSISNNSCSFTLTPQRYGSRILNEIVKVPQWLIHTLKSGISAEASFCLPKPTLRSHRGAEEQVKQNDSWVWISGGDTLTQGSVM